MVDTSRQAFLLLGLGVLSWLHPFLVSVPLISPEGGPIIDVFAFKTLMLLVDGVVGAVLFAYHVPRLGENYLVGTITADVVWFVLNVGLDLIVLVALLGRPAEEWVVGTGAQYLLLPIQAAAIGFVPRPSDGRPSSTRPFGHLELRSSSASSMMRSW